MSEQTNPDRRRFLGTAAVTLAAAPFAMSGSLFAQSGEAKPGAGAVRPGTHTSFAALKQIEAGVLMSVMPKPGPPMVPSSSSCTAGPTTSTPSSTSSRCWRRPASG